MKIAIIQPDNYFKIITFHCSLKCDVMRKQLPLHWLTLFNIIILSVVLIAGGIATWWQLHQANIHNNNNLALAQITTNQVSHSLQELLPLHLAIKDLNHTLQQFKYEFTLLYLDSKWDNSLFKHVSADLAKQKTIILQRWPSEQWGQELNEIRENLSIILDISQEALNCKNIGGIPQLYRDTESPIITINQTFQRLETALSEEAEADYERARKSSKITMKNIQDMSDIFAYINRNNVIIFVVLIILMMITELFLMRELHRRLLALANYSAKIAKGEFTTKPPFFVKDSTGTLAQALHTMAEEIQIAKETIHTLNANLEDKVKERTIALWKANQEITALNERLKEEKHLIESELQLTRRLQQAEAARQTAESANQAKSTFLANMSHELRTPLNGILGYAQILQRDKTLTKKQQEGISIIRRSGDYLLTLINDILDLSKIEADKVELSPVDIHFEDFLRSITDLFQIRAEQKHIAFLYEPLSHLPLGVRVDDKRLRQILINLLGNAIKFTEKGGVTFKVGYHQGKIRFQIEDTGHGIAPENLETIFQPFRQVGTRDSKAEGTGLGLSITQKLAKMMGGEIQVKSELNQGSIFWLELALPEVSDLIRSKRESEPIIIGLEGKPRKILIIDDKSENRDVIIYLLSPLGFEMIQASNGQEGIDKTCEYQPDLIITDLVMPVVDGFEFVRQIRAMDSFKQVPIIASSASVFEHDQHKSFAVGCNAFIPKPFHADTLLKLLQEQLNLRWICEQTTEFLVQTIETVEENFPLPNLATEQANILFDLAKIGDIGGILDKLDLLEQNDPQLARFINRIRQLAEDFEKEKICEILQQYRESAK
ncbi:MAG: hypothetical protein BWK79_09615 [Beggiatoa sp. IS2]|nr:MAG: hypothetical protein BWK79_09615 [Beggiatoa sp. IS2]